MKANYNVLIYKEANWYIAKYLKNNIVSQGKTLEEAYRNIKEAIYLYNS